MYRSDDTTTPRKRSEAQAAASRENGSKSRGPKTAEGMQRSSQNALKHGLRSRRVVLAHESQEEYDALLAGYKAEWQPVGFTENYYLALMVNAQWRIQRIQSQESGMYDAELFLQKPDFEACFTYIDERMRIGDAAMAISVHNAVILNDFRRAEAHHVRTYERSMDKLMKLQQLRKSDHPVLEPQPVNVTNEPENEPAAVQNAPEPAQFRYIAAFVPTRCRPNTDPRDWDDVAHVPDEPESSPDAA